MVSQVIDFCQGLSTLLHREDKRGSRGQRTALLAAPLPSPALKRKGRLSLWVCLGVCLNSKPSQRSG